MQIANRALPFISFFGIALGIVSPIAGLVFQASFCALQLFYLHRPHTAKAVFEKQGPAMMFSLLMNLMMVSPVLGLTVCAAVSLYALYAYHPLGNVPYNAASNTFSQTPGTLGNDLQPARQTPTQQPHAFPGTGQKLGNR